MYNEDLKRFYPDNPQVMEPGDFVRTDASGKIPAKQLPSYVDDVIEGYYYDSKFYEDNAHTKLITPSKGVIYLDLNTDNSYRWGGTHYVLIASPDMSNYAKRLIVTNIRELTTAQIEDLKCGDIVIKNESGNMHTYFVTYKEEHQGICLSYMDATIIETVSYDYIEEEWVYNSTDVGHLTSGT